MVRGSSGSHSTVLFQTARPNHQGIIVPDHFHLNTTIASGPYCTKFVFTSFTSPDSLSAVDILNTYAIWILIVVVASMRV